MKKFSIMKRILAILLAALMLCCVFVACDNGKDDTKGTIAVVAKGDGVLFDSSF